ncbi:MAG: hypothetical protein ACR2QA_18820 [Solirubrobacteraceae bacterium]
MASESLRPLGGIQPDVVPQIRVERLEPLLKRARDQMISRPRLKPIRVAHSRHRTAQRDIDV